MKSPGIGNDWPKWSPSTSTAPGDTTYYWITFSSIRSGTAQFYITPMTVKGGIAHVSYPALYLWNQSATESNQSRA